MCISVDLPEPDGPGDGDELARLDVEVAPAQRPHGHLADDIRLGEVLDGYDRRHGFLAAAPTATASTAANPPPPGPPRPVCRAAGPSAGCCCWF